MSMPKQLPFTLLVNSTDGYSDCWNPFFTLMAAYWPEYTDEVLLNAETKTFEHPGIRIKTTHSTDAATKKGGFPTWTQSILHALNQADSDIILYVQEDYFLKDCVNHNLLIELAHLMEAKSITYLGLTDEGQKGPFTPSGFDERLWKIDQKEQYRISLQACMFSKSRIRRYFRKHENPWHFEYYGNVRARRVKDSFYTLNRDIFSAANNPVFPYDLTGIINRQWVRKIVEDLFTKHGISVEFSKRGWHAEDPPIPRFKPESSFIKKAINTLKSLI
jgi:hypothetical protein